MAIAYDTASSAQATAASSISVSHTASGSDRAAFIGVGSSAESPDLTSTVTYGGSSCTEIWDFIGQTYAHNSSHYYIAPPTSSQTVTATLAGTDDELVIGVTSMTGVHQTTPIGTPQTANATSNAPSVNVSSATDELVVDNLYAITANTLTVGAGQTERWAQTIGTAVVGKGSTEVGSATTTMSWSMAGADIWTIGAVGFKPAGAAAASLVFRPNPMQSLLVR